MGFFCSSCLVSYSISFCRQRVRTFCEMWACVCKMISPSLSLFLFLCVCSTWQKYIHIHEHQFIIMHRVKWMIKLLLNWLQQCCVWLTRFDETFCLFHQMPLDTSQAYAIIPSKVHKIQGTISYWKNIFNVCWSPKIVCRYCFTLFHSYIHN